MTKQEAPAPEPEKKSVKSRGRFIDFAPKKAARPHKIEEIVEEVPGEPEAVVEEAPEEPLEETPEEIPEEASEEATEELSEDTSEETPEKPTKRTRRPLINTSGIFDFIRPKTAKNAPNAVVEHISTEGQVEDPNSGEIANVSIKSTKVTSDTATAVTTSISTSSPQVSRHLTVADVIRPKHTKHPQVTPEEVADFAEKEQKSPAFTPEELKQFADDNDEDLPPVNEDDLAVALAGFADEPDSPGLSTPVPTDDLSREAADFAEEIDALDELSSGDGDKIDTELAKALDLETKDFISEPQPLFEKPAKEKERKTPQNEHVSDQDFASGRGINYDPLVKDAEKAEEEARKRAEEKEKARIAKAKAEAPDGNMYTLGGRSPFLTSVHVEKRPLSQYVPSNMTSLETMANTPVKNTYRAKIKKALEEDAKEIHRQTLIVSTPVDSKTRSTALIFAIILTVLLGAGVGALIYLIFFQ